MYMMKWLNLFFFGLCAFAVNTQDVVMPEAIHDSFVKQLSLFPQEKIHIHTDRARYVPGEKIWFSAYVVDAFSHRPQTSSQYVYVELINSSDSLVNRVMISRDENGMFHGHVFLSDFNSEGDYILRAYTRYQENLGDDYFFKKPIRISNLKTGLLHPDGFAKNNKESINMPLSERKIAGDFDVSFYPEGGYLTEGVSCKTAFKALNKNGGSEPITGEIVDDEGVVITEVNTMFAGMGAFTFTPQAGKAYYLLCKNQNGQEKRFKLTDARKTYSIAVGYQRNRLNVDVKKSPDMPEKPLYLLVHCRGIMLYFAAWNYVNAPIAFSSDQFPSGILQIMLFDEQMNPISERLFFNKNDDQANLVYSTGKSSYQKRENVSSEIYITNAEGNPLSGRVSVVVTDDGDVTPDTLHTILSSLLLSSELKGTIESPGYYLQDHAEAKYALDLLMMTQGWRRYNISEAIKGNYMLPQTGYEALKEISGSVKSALLKRPVANSEVFLVTNDGGFMRQETDSAGLFSFFAHYPDNVQFLIQAKNQKGRSGVELVVNQEKFPVFKHIPISELPLPFNADKNYQTTVDTTDFMKKAELRAQYDDDMKLIQLSEVVVSAKRIEKKDEARLQFPLNSSSDITIYREDIEKRNPVKITEMLRTVAGIRILPDGNVNIRGRIAFTGGNLILVPPLLVVDGIPFNGLLDDLSVLDVEAIDIFKNAPVVFGSQGAAAGVISITTRRGENNAIIESADKITFAPLGYQKPVAFYSPKYDTPELKTFTNPDYRSTIYWKPDLIVSDDGKASFEFYTSDFQTTYSVVIEGISNDGYIIRQVEKIVVSD